MSNSKKNAVKKDKKAEQPMNRTLAMLKLKRMPASKLEGILEKYTDYDKESEETSATTKKGSYVEAMEKRNPDFFKKLEAAKAEAEANGNPLAVKFINRMERMNIKSLDEINSKPDPVLDEAVEEAVDEANSVEATEENK